VSDRVTEDAVKRAVEAALEADGWTVDVRWVGSEASISTLGGARSGP
jgi:hypothetical protein